MTKPKYLASALALLLAFVMFFSAVYVVLEAGHDCGGEGCAICTQIRACKDLLRDAAAAAVLLAGAWGFCALPGDATESATVVVCPPTLIALKVKLSN